MLSQQFSGMEIGVSALLANEWFPCRAVFSKGGLWNGKKSLDVHSHTLRCGPLAPFSDHACWDSPKVEQFYMYEESLQTWLTATQPATCAAGAERSSCKMSWLPRTSSPWQRAGTPVSSVTAFFSGTAAAHWRTHLWHAGQQIRCVYSWISEYDSFLWGVYWCSGNVDLRFFSVSLESFWEPLLLLSDDDIWLFVSSVVRVVVWERWILLHRNLYEPLGEVDQVQRGTDLFVLWHWRVHLPSSPVDTGGEGVQVPPT